MENNVSQKVIPCNHKRRHFITSFLCATFFASIVTVFFWLIIFQYITSPSFLAYTGLANNYVLTKPESITDPLMLHNIGELVRNGSIMSIKDLWSFESSFYQTIITVLIFLNALLGSVAFFVIRSSSIEHAKIESRKASADEVNSHIKSQLFLNTLSKLMNRKFKSIKDDVGFSSEDIWEAKNRITIVEQKNSELNQVIKSLTDKNEQLQTQINIISEHVSNLDDEDREGFELKISPKGDS